MVIGILLCIIFSTTYNSYSNSITQDEFRAIADGKPELL